VPLLFLSLFSLVGCPTLLSPFSLAHFYPDGFGHSSLKNAFFALFLYFKSDFVGGNRLPYQMGSVLSKKTFENRRLR